MKKLIVITLTSIISVGCSGGKDQNFKQVLKDNLEATRTVQNTFNDRNIPLKIILDQSKLNKYRIDKSQFIRIDSMTEVLDHKLSHQIENLINQKENSNDEKFYAASIEYLKFIRELEDDLKPFLESIEDTILGNEEELSIPVKENALRIETESRKWRIAEQEFYDKYDIQQTLVDSIENTLKE